MTALNIIDYFDELRPNSFDNITKLNWIKSVECDISKQLALYKEDEPDLDFIDSENPELILGEDYRDLYLYYLIAMADMTNGEFRMYSVSSAYFNSLYDKWKREERSCNMPACTASITV